MNAPIGEIKRGRKFDQVLEGARKIFLQDGFEGASVDLIAKEAGVSKATPTCSTTTRSARWSTTACC